MAIGYQVGLGASCRVRVELLVAAGRLGPSLFFRTFDLGTTTSHGLDGTGVRTAR
ncbi:hypothetical protein GCM10027265_35500 [Jatrophihabitans fulvus]